MLEDLDRFLKILKHQGRLTLTQAIGLLLSIIKFTPHIKHNCTVKNDFYNFYFASFTHS